MHETSQTLPTERGGGGGGATYSELAVEHQGEVVLAARVEALADHDGVDAPPGGARLLRHEAVTQHFLRHLLRLLRASHGSR